MMSEAVMLSIRPKWCELIANGRKTIEVRKTRPKLDTPFKCYIYQTRGDAPCEWVDGKLICKSEKCAKVIGEFVCDVIDAVVIGNSFEEHSDLQKHTCLSELQMNEYLNGSVGYGWQISDLKMYDKPKELCKFMKPCPYEDVSCIKCEKSGFGDYMYCENRLTRPPQSWCYVEELK